MLSTADADLAQRDPALAGLNVVLDTDAFAAALRRCHPNVSINDVQLTYIRYRPTRLCLGAYRIDVKDAQPLSAHITTYNATQWAKHSVAADHHRMLPDRTVISLFPEDNRLTSLAHLIAPDTRHSVLTTLLPDISDSHDLQTLAYKPQRRYVGRIGNAHDTAAVLKHYRKQEYRKAAVATAADYPTTNRLRIPRVLGQSQRHHTLAFEWLPGQSLYAETTTAPNPDSLYATGAALAEFHTLPTTALQQRGADGTIAKLTAAVATVSQLCPPLASHAQRLAKHIAHHISQEVPTVARLHGDFHAKQVVLMPNQQIAIVDLDENIAGDPRVDLGLFIAHFYDEEYQQHITPSQTASLIDALLEGYQTTARRQISDTLHYHVAAALFSLIHKPFRVHRPNWVHGIHTLLGHVSDILHSPYTQD